MAGLIVILVIVAAMIFSGCVEKEQELSAAEIKAMVLANAGEIDTYKFDLNMAMKMLKGNETGETEMTAISNGCGVVDLVDKKMKLNLNTSTERPKTEVPESTEMEMYLVNNTLYLKMGLGIPQLPVQWTKREMPDEFWASQNQLGLQMELLNISEVELLEDERVNGVDCYVLKIVPDMNKFWDSTMAAAMNKSAQSLAPGVDLKKMLKSISSKEWIAKDTTYPMKTQMAISLVVSSDDLAIPETNEKITMTDYEEIEMRFYDYNKPVSIEFPEVAEGAVG